MNNISRLIGTLWGKDTLCDNKRTMYVMSMCCAQSFSRVPPFVTPWTVAQQAPLSTEFSRQEYWSGLPFPSPVMSIYYDKYT